MANDKNYKLTMEIAGKVNASLPASVKSAKATLKGFDSAFSSLDKGYNAVMQVGRTAFRAIGIAATAAATATIAAGNKIIEAGSSMEAAFAGVQKTVRTTKEGYDDLHKAILEMMKDTPSSYEEIAYAMETGGQLGIAAEAIPEFAKTMLDIGNVANDLTSEEAATQFAKFANIMQMANVDESGISNWERLGSTVLRLGNTYATTEGSIASMAMRLAATGKQVGLTESQILAMSTAMSSVGISEAVGGSSMSKLLKKMQLDVETGGSDYATVANMSAAEFNKLFKTDAAAAVSKFIHSLADANKAGVNLDATMAQLGLDTEVTAEDLEELGVDSESAVAILSDLKLNEIRLSNTILALAGNEDLLDKALQDGAKAWQENSALAEYTAVKYSTLESQTQLFKNSLQELGWSVYEDIRDPFSDVMSWLTGKIGSLTEELTRSNKIKQWLDDIGAAIPTFARKIKKIVTPVFEGIKNVISWIIKNKTAVIGVIAGIGGALATYKILQTVNKIAQGIKGIISMLAAGPYAWIIAAIVAVGAAIAGVATTMKVAREEAIKANLAEHFGDISLSLKELEEVSALIVNSRRLEALGEAFASLQITESIAQQIEETNRELNKLEWKANLSFDLTEKEQQSYVDTIQAFIDECSDYALQAGYTVKIALSLLDWDDDKDSIFAQRRVENGIDRFYTETMSEMQELGRKLSTLVNEAFADGILDPDEINNIADTRRKLAELQQKIELSEGEAKLSRIGSEFTNSGQKLTADSFLNLVEQNKETLSGARETAASVYDTVVAAAINTFGVGSQGYEDAKNAAEKTYANTMAELENKAYSYAIDTMFAAYAANLPQDMDAFKNEVAGVLEQYYRDVESGTANIGNLDLTNWLNIDDVTASALQKLYNEALKPGLESLYTQLNNATDPKIRKQLQLTIDKIEGLAAILDSTQGEYYLLSEWTKNGVSSAEEEAEENAAEFGNKVVNSVVRGMIAKAPALQNETAKMRLLIKRELEAALDITIPLTVQGVVKETDTTKGAYSGFKVERYASGGFITHPELSWVGEEGPEAVIPLNSSQRAYDLLDKTNRLMGMQSRIDGVDVSTQAHSVNYSPVLNFYGAAPSREDLDSALKMSQDEFESMMDRYIRKQARLAF